MHLAGSLGAIGAVSKRIMVTEYSPSKSLRLSVCDEDATKGAARTRVQVRRLSGKSRTKLPLIPAGNKRS